MPGVASVQPTLLYINACRANLDLITLHGVPTTGEDALHDMDVVAGDLTSWKTTSDGALVGKRLAQRRGLKPGDRLQLVDGNVQIDVRVAGVVTSRGAGLDNVAFVHLDLLQQARKKVGTVTELFVRLEPGTDAEALARAIDERFKTDQVQTDTKTLQAFVQGAVGEVAEVVGFGRLLGYLAVAVVVLILANTVTISAQTRVAELATMETLGAPRALLAALIAVESVLLALAGGLVGLGGVMAWLHLAPVTLGIEGVGIDVAPDPSLALVGAALAVVVGLVAAAGPVIGLLRRPLALAVKPV
jgi:putative ABC transport system permease protein